MNAETKFKIAILSDYNNFKNNIYSLIPLLPIKGVVFKFYDSVNETKSLVESGDIDIVILNKSSYTINEMNYLLNIDYKYISGIYIIDSYFKYEQFFENHSKGFITVRRPLSINKFLEVLKISIYGVLKKKKSKKDIDLIRTLEMAKSFLIMYENMFEDESHKYLEKLAMDNRTTIYKEANLIISKYLLEKENINYECED